MIFDTLYNIALITLGICYIPKALTSSFLHGKYRSSLARRFGRDFPKITKGTAPLIWIHAVSVGETKAIVPLVKRLKKSKNPPTIVISSITETGHAEARKSLPFANYHVYLPLDLPWLIRPIIRQAKPDLVILAETDYWYNFLSAAKNEGAKIAVVNGKISKKSTKMFQRFPFYSKKIFDLIDIFCLQSEHYLKRFLSLEIPEDKFIVSGNLKFDDSIKALTKEEIAKEKISWGIDPKDMVVVLGSTHDKEEKEILALMKNVWKKHPTLRLFIVPRHPERFQAVAELLAKEKIAFCRFSDKKPSKTTAQVYLIDIMGQLLATYQFADVAIVCGSFTSKVGGHNIIEPASLGVPVLYGPHMHSQPELTELVTKYQCGQQVAINQLEEVLESMLCDEAKRLKFGENAKLMIRDFKGATERTFQEISKNLKKDPSLS